MKTGHVAPGVPLSRVKKCLAQVKSSVVEAPVIISVRMARPELTIDFRTLWRDWTGWD